MNTVEGPTIYKFAHVVVRYNRLQLTILNISELVLIIPEQPQVNSQIDVD